MLVDPSSSQIRIRRQVLDDGHLVGRNHQPLLIGLPVQGNIGVYS